MFSYTEVKADARLQAISYVVALKDILEDLRGVLLAHDLVSFVNGEKEKLAPKLFNAIDDAYSKFSQAYLAFLYLNQYKLKNNELSNKVDQICNFHLFCRLVKWPTNADLNRLMEKLKNIISSIEKFKFYIQSSDYCFIDNLDHLNGEFLKIDEEFYKVITSIHVKKAE